MILETERLILTPVAEADAASLYPLMSDAEVMAHWDIEPVDDPEVVEAVVLAQARAMANEEAFYWTMKLAAGGAFLGCCELGQVDWRHRRAEVGFMMARPAWGQGYAAEAMGAVVGYAATLGLKRLWARTHVGNARSEALLLKLGFEEEGYLRGHIDRDGERRDCRLWGLLL